MRLIVTISFLALLYAAPAHATDELMRKPGLWEVKTSIGQTDAPARAAQQCIDAATDQMLQSAAGPFNPAACPERNVQHAADETTIDFKCDVAGKPATAHSVLTGNLDSAYRLTVTAQSEDIAGGKMVMTMDGKWLGPCPADQKPGDVTLGNGTRVNIPEMQKRSLSDIPVAPQQQSKPPH
ncbi:MAG: DUF3617 family protein [Methylobacteriaceae bacterium]|nr:DUF3617 family protein [Methylobacteriaceae bacterium]